MRRIITNAAIDRWTKYKIATIVILLAGVCFLTYYYHVVLQTGTVFTHFFYIPIILLTLWWKKKGLIGVVFLAGLLIFSHIFLRSNVITLNDYTRAFMFVIVGVVVALLSERGTKALQESEKYRHTLSKRVRELDCLYSLSRLTEKYDNSLDKILQQAIQLIRDAWHQPEYTYVRLVIEDKEFETGNPKAAENRLSDNIVWNGREIGFIEVCLHKERLKDGEEPFNEEEKKLIKAIAEWLGKTIECKRAEDSAQQHLAELNHIWRVNTVGEMACAFAHEINQPLCAILNYSNGCLRMVRKDGIETAKVTDAVEQIVAQTDRACEIIQRIRNLVAKQQPQQSMVDVNEIIKEAITMLRFEAERKNIIIRTKLIEEMPLILTDQIGIQQVILNLLKNAFDAMSETESNRQEVSVSTSIKNAAIETVVCDRGIGFYPGTAERIFDSFFTTKPQGLGIGLPLSQKIIEANGGRLWAESNPEGGAIFKFTLPFKGAKCEQVRADCVRCG